MYGTILVKRKLNKVIVVATIFWFFTIVYYVWNDSIESIKQSVYDSYSNYNNNDSQGYVPATVEQEEHEETKSNYTSDPLMTYLFSQNIDVRDIPDQPSSIYTKVFSEHSVSSIIGNLNFDERCVIYFKSLVTQDQNWHFTPNNWDKLFEDGQFDHFKEKYLEKLKKEFKHEEGDESYESEFQNYLLGKYEDYKTSIIEQHLIDHLAAVRIFNKCYISNDDQTQIKQTNKFINTQRKQIQYPDGFSHTELEKLHAFDVDSVLESRVYPWLSFENPTYEHWTGDIYYHPPDMTRPKHIQKRKYSKSSFLKQFQNSCNGKGIVLTIPESHIDTTIRLISLLRALNNQLPIQIIYDNLSKSGKQQLINAAREDFVVLPQSFKKVAKHFPSDYKTHGLPKQDIWFVNVANAIHVNYRDKFQTWYSKFLATLFNSFNEFILMDDDTVLLQNPEYFFDIAGYKQSGAYFYKDRTGYDGRGKDQLDLFKKLSPSLVDSVMFNMPLITNHTLSLNTFKNGLYHLQESGVVVINRDTHFTALLMILQLNQIDYLRDRVLGDKELFWLGFVIAGDESFEFNNNHAASIGLVTPHPEERHRPDGSSHRSVEICSPHPGHIDNDNHTLAWINSGFRFCHSAHEIDYEHEVQIGRLLKSITQAFELEKLYESPLRINHAVVPAFDGRDHPNNQDEPDYGWLMDGGYCKGYMWCGYSSIGGTTNDDTNNSLDGLLVEFEDWEKDLFTYYGDIWVGLE
ncbi:uncharacterized protein J8A68_002116 [[Candida] subhashii]|uniref:Alpha-1,3-mannosyltransferase n=1 Tax=[Candida] subhashii TaxID=561895 RepID=A0A8J5QZ70_9ASCO|nr:uncharacterized protein J8A68_002116 [[Candida] subhashii]KAG7664375.1 hypothetical protein J8A68_002116 [[Candida] subhashii]